jgi:hypothetical protein
MICCRAVNPILASSEAVLRWGIPESLPWNTVLSVCTQVLATSLQTPQSHRHEMQIANQRPVACSSLMFTAAAHRLATLSKLTPVRASADATRFWTLRKTACPSLLQHPPTFNPRLANNKLNSCEVPVLGLHTHFFSLQDKGVSSFLPTSSGASACFSQFVTATSFFVCRSPDKPARRHLRRYLRYRRHPAHRNTLNFSLPTSILPTWLNNSTWVV